MNPGDAIIRTSDKKIGKVVRVYVDHGERRAEVIWLNGKRSDIAVHTVVRLDTYEAMLKRRLPYLKRELVDVVKKLREITDNAARLENLELVEAINSIGRSASRRERARRVA